MEDDLSKVIPQAETHFIFRFPPRIECLILFADAIVILKTDAEQLIARFTMLPTSLDAKAAAVIFLFIKSNVQGGERRSVSLIGVVGSAVFRAEQNVERCRISCFCPVDEIIVQLAVQSNVRVGTPSQAK